MSKSRPEEITHACGCVERWNYATERYESVEVCNYCRAVLSLVEYE